MEIIKPHYNLSKPVTNWNAVEDIAKEMETLFAANEHLFALSNTYVSEQPYSFFVLNDKSLVKDFIPVLGSKYIINPKIKGFIEASMMDLPEGCSQFPYRSPKKVNRAVILKVEYFIPDPLQKTGLRKVEKEVERIMAQIFQHEIDHMEGRNIYFKSPKA